MYFDFVAFGIPLVTMCPSTECSRKEKNMRKKIYETLSYVGLAAIMVGVCLIRYRYGQVLLPVGLLLTIPCLVTEYEND